MEIKLAESIRTFRKERSLTQEQLAEVLGVTVGAVYKWEAGLSTPELPLIVEMVDFFDTSIDVLLGYILKDNRIDATARRLRHCQRVKDLNGLEEAEKALKKYPNSFIIVYRSAMLYQALGLYKRDNAKLRRALELLEKEVPLFLVKGEGRCRALDERVERFAEKITDHLVVIDPRDYPLNGIDDAFRWIMAPCVVSTLLVDRLAAHFEHYTGHDLNIRRYYRQFDY